MIQNELLDILVCPESHQPLTLADETLIGRINAAAEAGSLKDRSGSDVAPVEGALVREDGTVAYAIRDSIPIMLIDESFSLETLS